MARREDSNWFLAFVLSISLFLTLYLATLFFGSWLAS